MRGVHAFVTAGVVTGGMLLARSAHAAPVITVTSPLDAAVARGSERIAASCSSCTSLEVHRDSAGGPLVTAGLTTVDVTPDFTAENGKLVPLYFVAKDAAGATTSTYRVMFVETSTRLVELESVPGQILDIDPTRILYSDTTGLHVRVRGGGADTLITAGATGRPFLTDQGALWADGEWDGVTVKANAGGFIAARGSWAVAIRPEPAYPSSANVVLKNLATGGETPILYPTSVSDGAVTADLGDNGVVAMSRLNISLGSTTLFWFRNGVTTSYGGTQHVRDPRTDGTNMAYLQWGLGVPSKWTFLITSTGAQTGLSTYPDIKNYVGTDDSYGVSEGWAAMTRPQDLIASPMNHVWVRAPDATYTQVTNLPANTLIDVGGPGAPVRRTPLHDGAVMVIANGTRYLASTTAAPDPISTSLGGARYVGGQWNVIIGGSVFRIGAACAGNASEPCGNCGTHTRTCADGVWTAWGACTGEGVCAANATEACGAGGTRTCSASCQWGACTGQICDGPATQACGNCGTQTRTCNNSVWTAWGACTGEGVCAPGSAQACGAGGTQSCGGSCAWGACANQTCDGAATQPCGNCGTQTRTCNNGTWSSWSACSGEGLCAPNESRACAGGVTQTCGGSCQWGACEGKTCVGPASEPCCANGTRTRTCSTGSWSEWSACSEDCASPEPEANNDDDGASAGGGAACSVTHDARSSNVAGGVVLGLVALAFLKRRRA